MPSFPNPKLPTNKSPVPGYEDRQCGEATWHMDVEIRAPYQGMDKYAEALPPVLGFYEANDLDLDVSVPIFYEDSNLANIADAVAGAQEILNRYQSDGLVDSANADSIRTYITRAAQYLSQARSLKDEWDKYSSGAGSPR